MDTFARRECSDRMKSGIGGEISEVDDPLSAMLDAKKSLRASRDAETLSRSAEKRHKEDFGLHLMANSMVCSGGAGAVDTVGSVSGENVGKGRTKRHRLEEGENGGLSRLASSLPETDMAGIKMEKERLAVHRERMVREESDRGEERSLRKEEGEAREKFESTPPG